MNGLVGIDIIRENRFEEIDLYKEMDFYKKIFTTREINSNLDKEDPDFLFSQAFSIKEAIWKVVDVEFKEIEIINESDHLDIYLDDEKLEKYGILVDTFKIGKNIVSIAMKLY